MTVAFRINKSALFASYSRVEHDAEVLCTHIAAPACLHMGMVNSYCQYILVLSVSAESLVCADGCALLCRCASTVSACVGKAAATCRSTHSSKGNVLAAAAAPL
jgi:hypothetical protein